ncbi:lipopolysaccharide biosynthesis protein [Pseudomonas sp. FSL W5-0299]|uniref:lipopolysaccharide biosynthesis protein n=1 Tax=Pseudomonas sp. FSL W5-0299 TaxID=1917484 RepID=UPI00098A75C7|nr:oligosaccharide flippase family protein [Pseudomonas sp. FSL W5-0299]OOL38567.1 hypothetical protein BOO94_07445 [Pseudomonas sp. FSL W5-0299]
MNFRTVSVYAVGTSLGALLSLLTLPLLAWLFPPDDVGRIALFQLSLSLIVVFFSFGLDQSYVRNFNEVINTGLLAKSCLVPGLSALLLSIIVIYFYAEEFTYWLFEIKNQLLFLVFFVSAVILYFERFFSVFLRMKELSFAYSMTRVFPKLLFLLLVLCVYFFPEMNNFTALAIMQGLSWLLVVLIMAFYLRIEYRPSDKGMQESVSIKALFYFGFPLMLNGLAFWGLSFLDRIMLKQLSSLSELAVYSIASTLAGVAILFQQIFTTIWHPMIYKWVADGVAEEKVGDVIELVQFISLVLIAVVALFSFIVSWLLPESYAATRFMLPACMVPPLFIMIAEVSGVGVSISRKTRYLPIVTVISMMLNLLLNYILIPQFGAGGAAAASAIAFLLYIFLRAEVSNLLWVRFPHGKFFICSSSVVFVSVVVSLYGDDLGVLPYFMWLGVLILSAVFYTNKFLYLIGLVRGRL